jgi:exodeoxyribonuclease VII small subunit
MDKQSSYARTRERLEEIVAQVKAKDMPLEKSLDLYEEALRLGNVCAEMIDRTDFSAEELQAVEPSDEENAEDAIDTTEATSEADDNAAATDADDAEEAADTPR